MYTEENGLVTQLQWQTAEGLLISEDLPSVPWSLHYGALKISFRLNNLYRERCNCIATVFTYIHTMVMSCIKGAARCIFMHIHLRVGWYITYIHLGFAQYIRLVARHNNESI